MTVRSFEILTETAKAWRDLVDKVPSSMSADQHAVIVSSANGIADEVIKRHDGEVTADFVAGIVTGAALHSEFTRAFTNPMVSMMQTVLGGTGANDIPMATVVASCLAARILDGTITTERPTT